jgi:hypothetical protein
MYSSGEGVRSVCKRERREKEGVTRVRKWGTPKLAKYLEKRAPRHFTYKPAVLLFIKAPALH